MNIYEYKTIEIPKMNAEERLKHRWEAYTALKAYHLRQIEEGFVHTAVETLVKVAELENEIESLQVEIEEAQND